MQHPFQTPSPPAPSTVVNKKRSEHVLQTPVGQIYRTDPISAIQTQKAERPPVSSPTNSVCSEVSTTSTDSLRIKKKKPVKVVSSKFMQGTTSSATPVTKPLPKREKESVRTVRPPRLPPSNGDCPIPKKPEKKTDMKPPATVTRTASLRPRQPSDASVKPSGTFTRTPSLQRLRSSTASTKPEPETTEPSPDTIRRVPAAPSSQAAEICFDDNEAEIEVLQARLLQWNFINGRATQAFEAQKRQVETQFKSVYSHIIGLKYELNQSKDMLHSFDSKEKLDKVITTQMNLLNNLNSRIEDFKENYLSLAAAAQSTSEIMPVSGVLLEDMGLLYQEIRSCGATIECILGGHEQEISKTTEMAQTIHNLWKNMQEIILELNECNDLFKELSEIQKIENSHMLESILKV